MTQRRLRLLASAVVVVPAIAYLGVAFSAGVSFPSRDECVRLAPPGESAELELVWGRTDDPNAAEELRARVVSTGFIGAETRPDGCGRWKVIYDGIEDYANGMGVVREGTRAGFDPQLELAPA